MARIVEAATPPAWAWQKRCSDCRALVEFTQDDIRFGCRGYHFAGTFESGVPHVTCPTPDCHRRWDLDSPGAPRPDHRALAAARRAQTAPATPGGTP